MANPISASPDFIDWAIALNGDPREIRALLQSGRGAEERCPSLRTPAMWASKMDNVEALMELVVFGCDLEAKSTGGLTALGIAVGSGSCGCVRALIEAGADVASQDAGGETPLCAAARLGRTECLVVLIKAGADVEHRNSDGATPLMLAAQSDNDECVERLVMGGAALDVICPAGRSALVWSAQRGSARALEALLKAGASHGVGAPASAAAEGGQLACLRRLLAAGADPDVRDACGHTALLVAAKAGRLSELVELVEHTACDMFARGHDGRGAMFLARIGGHSQCLDYMRSCAPDWDQAMAEREKELLGTVTESPRAPRRPGARI